MVNVQSKIQYSSTHVCPLEISIIDVDNKLGFTFYVTSTCFDCINADPDDSEYKLYMKTFKILSNRIVSKTSATRKASRAKIRFRPDSRYDLDWAWYLNYNYNDVYMFIKEMISVTDNILFIYSTYTTGIYMRQFEASVSRFDNYYYINNFIMNTNVFDLCTPAFHRYLPSNKNCIRGNRNKRLHFMSCSGYICYAIYNYIFSDVKKQEK